MEPLNIDSLSVGLRCHDPLVARFLTTELETLGFATQRIQSIEPAELSDCDVLVWDAGLTGQLPESLLPEAIPTVVLCASSTTGSLALASGCLAAIDRTRPIAHLVAAIQAAVVGLQVSEPGWTDTSPPVQMDSPLTPREQEVLERMAEGLPNREIGRLLYVSEHTVRFHVRSILEKLDATSRTQAVVVAARSGMLDF